MQLKVLCDAAGIVCPENESEREINGISSDSSRVGEGFLFVCIRGLRADGHAYIGEAIGKGAVCVLTDRYADVSAQKEDALILQCGDTRAALAHLWHAWYGFPARQLKLIGVTGTNGKTSVTHMIRAILEGNLHRCGIIGTVGCISCGRVLESSSNNALANMTTPDPEELYRVLSEMVKDRVEYAVMEVSSHALALKKLEPLHFRVGIFTNLTPEHLDFHKTMEAYAAAKAELFEKCELCIFNADSPYVSYMETHANGRSLCCTAKDADADYCAEGIELLAGAGVRYRLRSLRTRINLSCPIPGAFTVSNSMQAAIAALELGCPPAVIKTVLGAIPPVKGRMERVRLGVGADFTVIIDYAHTPDAMEKLLKTARELVGKGGRLTLLFGCGGDRDKTKRAVMGRIASSLADEVILTSDNSRSEEPEQILREILSGMEKPPLCVLTDREEAIHFAVGQARAGDVLLLAGKGHEEYEITKAGKRPFCEQQIAKDAFAKRVKDQTEPTI